MKLVHLGEKAFYEKLTVSLGLENLCRIKGWDFELHDVDSFLSHNKTEDIVDEAADVVTFSACHLKMYKRTVKWLKDSFPNAYIISLGSDSIAYLHGFPSQGQMTWKNFEFCSPEHVDLHLDLLSEVVDRYNEMGIKSDQWMWSASEAHLSLLEALYKNMNPTLLSQKELGFYSLIAVKTPYREKLRAVLTSGEVNAIIGPAEGNLDTVYRDYTRACITVGTTSGSWTPQRTMKGFRDWIAPVLGSVLVYDNHPDVLKLFPAVWTYDYEKPEELFDLLYMVTGNSETQEYNQARYDYIVQMQKDWAYANTIERQFEKIIEKYVVNK